MRPKTAFCDWTFVKGDGWLLIVHWPLILEVSASSTSCYPFSSRWEVIRQLEPTVSSRDFPKLETRDIKQNRLSSLDAPQLGTRAQLCLALEDLPPQSSIL